jgi:hypothetical protein
MRSRSYSQISQAAARLALLLRRLGQPAEVADLALLSAEAAPADGTQAQALSRTAMAASASAAGKHRLAERLGREAVALVPDEMVQLRADVLDEVAEVLLASGQRQSAQQASSEAARLYVLKGIIVFGEAGTASGPDVSPLVVAGGPDDQVWFEDQLAVPVAVAA